uniref:Actin maturation protease n=1 Tax=Parascaris univalens TaxID=6257 RepID=A0A915AQH4_PARUN
MALTFSDILKEGNDHIPFIIFPEFRSFFTELPLHSVIFSHHLICEGYFFIFLKFPRLSASLSHYKMVAH